MKEFMNYKNYEDKENYNFPDDAGRYGELWQICFKHSCQL